MPRQHIIPAENRAQQQRVCRPYGLQPVGEALPESRQPVT